MVRKFFSIRILLVLLIAALPAVLYAQADFYKGKNLTIIQGREPGGSGDLRTKALVSFLQKYIPGNPTIVMEYMGAPAGARRQIFSTGRRAPTGSRSATRASV
jgi:tripartite-type tricarboxylate transporter receptor subunit TctC